MSNKRLVIITRAASADHGTFGVLETHGLRLHTLELPWRDNMVRKSCIPAGQYECGIVQSPKFGHVYGVHNVPGRSHILFHSGNWGGNTDKGLKSHIDGCILLGLRTGVLEGQEAILSSRDALKEFMRVMEDKPFTLHIVNG